MDTIFNGGSLFVTISFGVVGAMYMLFSKGQDAKFERVIEQVKDIKDESKTDDHDVRLELRRVDNTRVDQITALHIRIDKLKDMECVLAQRVAKMEGFQEGVKSEQN